MSKPLLDHPWTEHFRQWCRRVSMVGLAALVVMFAAPSVADVPMPQAEVMAHADALYAKGDYVAAAKAAEELATAPGYALAARALLAHATTSAARDDRLVFIDQAEALALQALALDETYVEGHLQLVVAMGHRGKAQNAVMSQFEGLIGLTRRHIDRALELEPDNAWAHAISGGWHLELVRRDPIGFTNLIYGARRSKGIAAFERSLELDPQNIVLHVQYALTLIEFNRKKFRDRATAALLTARALDPVIAYDDVLKARAEHVLTLFKADDKRALLHAVHNYNSLNLDDVMPPQAVPIGE